MRPAVLPLLNLLVRAHVAYFLWEVLAHAQDRRFAGKAIPIRNLVIVGGMSLLFPALQVLTGRWRRYPWGYDTLYLSVYWLDMAGNSFDLYDRYFHFDLIPHFHGTGAFALVFERGLGMGRSRALLWSNVFHVALEAQEFLTDVFFGTHNVRGWWDSFGDIASGLLGTFTYTAAGRALRLPVARRR